MLVFLQSDPLTPTTWFTGVNALWAMMVILITGAISILILLAKRKDMTQDLLTKRADASDALTKTRDQQLADCMKAKGLVEDELEEITAEYKTVVSIKLDELFKFWQTKEDNEAHWLNIEDENRVLKKRLTEKGTRS